ncbi:MAG TPA: hypothetical protein VFT16_02760 [Candidatus Saccharimonadales bacterium]|nr:hypothetical protein [Candidatus Saccharimonadales bacterium]
MKHSTTIGEQRTYLYESEVAAASACCADLQQLPEEIKKLDPIVQEYLERTDNVRYPAAIPYQKARRLRRVPMRIVAELYKGALAPAAIRMLKAENGGLAGLVESDAWFAGQSQYMGLRDRNHPGDRGAVVYAMKKSLLQDVHPHIFDTVLPADAGLLLDTYTDLTQKLKMFAGELFEDLAGEPPSEALLESPFGEHATDYSQRLRELAFCKSKLEDNLPDLLRENSIPSQAEFFGVGLEDLDVAFAAANCPEYLRYPMALRSVRVLGSLATLTSSRATTMLFSQPHSNLWRADADDSGTQWTVRATQQPLSGEPAGRPHRCVAPDLLSNSFPHTEEQTGLFVAQLNLCADQVVMQPHEADLASMIAAYALGVQNSLRLEGVIA